MIARSSRIVLEVVAGVLAVAVLLGLVAFWRLSSGPVHLDFLTPQIEAALDDPDSGFSFRIGRTELTWVAERRSVDLLRLLTELPSQLERIATFLAVLACLAFCLLMLKGSWDYWYPFVTKRAFLETDDVPMAIETWLWSHGVLISGPA